MKNIVVLISGNGSNLQAIIDACARKQINGTLRAVFSNKADAFGLLYFCVAPRRKILFNWTFVQHNSILCG